MRGKKRGWRELLRKKYKEGRREGKGYERRVRGRGEKAGIGGRERVGKGGMKEREGKVMGDGERGEGRVKGE